MNETATTQVTSTAGTARTGLVSATIAGITSTAGVVALFVGLSASNAAAIPVPDHGAGPIVATTPYTDDATRPRPCFMIRPHWNTALDGPQPTC